MVVMEEVCECVVGMRNAFSPNNDGRNDNIFPMMDDGCDMIRHHFHRVTRNLGAG